MARRSRDPHRLSPLQVLGAWTGVWAPPRDADVPPVPWRRVGLAVLAGTLVIGGLWLAVSPAIEGGKRTAAERERAAAAERGAERRARLEREQRPRTGRAPVAAAPPGAARAPALELRARRAVVAALERAIAADARSRARAGELRGPIRRVACERFPRSTVLGPPEEDLRAGRGRYDCLAVTSDIRAVPGSVRGAIGYPFRAVADFRRRGFAWCRIAGRPGELAIERKPPVPLPRPCR